MRGLLADVNVQGYLTYLCQLIESLDVMTILADMELSFVTFPELDLPQELEDRFVWQRCQQDGWVLLTENRNNDGPDSLEATLRDSWRIGHLPVLTLSSKEKLEHNREYGNRVAKDVADLMFDIAHGGHRDRPRIYIPR